MTLSITFSFEEANLARHKLKLQSRSVAGQINDWVRMGRANEKSGNFDHGRIAAALTKEGKGRLV